jgi:hypothetical protein
MILSVATIIALSRQILPAASYSHRLRNVPGNSDNSVNNAPKKYRQSDHDDLFGGVFSSDQGKQTARKGQNKNVKSNERRTKEKEDKHDSKGRDEYNYGHTPASAPFLSSALWATDNGRHDGKDKSKKQQDYDYWGRQNPAPTPFPTYEPTIGPMSKPSDEPTSKPTPNPTSDPTSTPTISIISSTENAGDSSTSSTVAVTFWENPSSTVAGGMTTDAMISTEIWDETTVAPESSTELWDEPSEEIFFTDFPTPSPSDTPSAKPTTEPTNVCSYRMKLAHFLHISHFFVHQRLSNSHHLSTLHPLHQTRQLPCHTVPTPMIQTLQTMSLGIKSRFKTAHMNVFQNRTKNTAVFLTLTQVYWMRMKMLMNCGTIAGLLFLPVTSEINNASFFPDLAVYFSLINSHHYRTDTPTTTPTPEPTTKPTLVSSIH